MHLNPLIRGADHSSIVPKQYEMILADSVVPPSVGARTVHACFTDRASKNQSCSNNAETFDLDRTLASLTRERRTHKEFNKDAADLRAGDADDPGQCKSPTIVRINVPIRIAEESSSSRSASKLTWKILGLSSSILPTNVNAGVAVDSDILILELKGGPSDHHWMVYGMTDQD